MVRHAGAAPARRVWKTLMLAVTSMPHGKVGTESEVGVKPLGDHRLGRAVPQLPDRLKPSLQHRLAFLMETSRTKMVAGVGIAPTSAGLQPAAHLSELSSVDWSLCVVTLHGLPVIDRLLCC